ncbi:cellulase family glycosylhydrolase [Sphingosinicella sp. BN140058]|uniref:glycoside hydrolase 5 family protein n=1 Tax=Sphingosinicella sp. BN140058 TaxID=1892855 RepID=UPI001012FE06|nr:cellulase family glycosylhydrolase [Sphingosinicella sp. BN140058]QAY77330.1 mannanase [Sphingosinicella sp. BN140058]
MFDRRTALLSGAALLAGCAASGTGPGGAAGSSRFVRADGTRFRVGDEIYRYAGANIWYAAYLGANAAYGNRDRLKRELDSMAALGIDNLRILGSAELSPLKNSITPGFRTETANYNETLLTGLDFALAEMGKRGMKAVIYLTNFWEWSGGMMTYLYWTNGGRYINMNDPAHPWPEFADMNAAFYTSDAAIGLYHDYVRAVVGRTNSLTGIRYADDPAIMAWQLANEPRPAGSEAVGRPNLPAFYAWIGKTANLIKSIDPNHLVSTGSEGLQGCHSDAQCVISAHEPAGVDYLTTHIWPLNWTWVDSADLPGTYDAGAGKVRTYIADHIALATRLGKPLVIEEFGFPRDRGLFDPASSTSFKDRFYRLIYDSVLADAKNGGPTAGSNFWAWGGEGRASSPDHRFQPGDTTYLGDPPHEPQGWYSVFDSDESTKAVIREHAGALKALRA